MQQACNPTKTDSCISNWNSISYKVHLLYEEGISVILTLAKDSYTRLGQELAEEFDLSWQGAHRAV